MDLIITCLGLRHLIQLLRAGDAGVAGHRQSKNVNGVAEQASSCLGISCGCYVLLCIGWLLFATIDWLVGLVAGR